MRVSRAHGTGAATPKDGVAAAGAGKDRNMTTRITAAVMVLLMLSGCMNADKVQRPAVLDDRLCRVHGHSPPEQAYLDCLGALDQARTGRSCFSACH